MIKNTIVLLIIFQSYLGIGQTVPSIIPPSPEASSLLKFTEVPVSLYTGLPNIEIPLFVIESGGVTVPISLSYHARGIKVAEIGSRVGLGWALNAGGMISRQIRDKPDERNGYLGIGNSNTYTTTVDSVNFFNSQTKRALTGSYNGEDSYNDFVPDQYFFNTGTGLSGKFIYDYNDGEILPQNYSNVKVFGKNHIRDGKGNNFYFEESGDYDEVTHSYIFKEFQDNEPLPVESSYTANTWHLKGIVTQTGKSILFTYDHENSIYMRRSYDKFQHTDDSNTQPGYRNYSSKISSLQNRLKEINFDKGRVVFNYTENRPDVAIGSFLSSVELFDIRGNLIEKKILSYATITTPKSYSLDNTNMQLWSYDKPASKRFFLKSIQTEAGHVTSVNTQNETVPPYQFIYDENELPNRHSNSQDIWGYYNGKSNGEFLKSSYPFYSDGGRGVDEVKSGAGMLKKIIHPTGGSTEFFYEQNKVINKYFPTRQVFFENPNPLVLGGLTLTAIEHAMTDSIRSQPIYSSSERLFTKAFIIPNGVARSSIKFKANLGIECTPPIASNCKFHVKLYSIDGTFVTIMHPPNATGWHTLNNLLPGTYLLKVYATDPNYNPANPILPDGSNYFSVDIKWLSDIEEANEVIYAGGKRIKKIIYKDSESAVPITKTYSYIDPVTGTSSGVLFGLSNFLGINKTVQNYLAAGDMIIFEPFGNVPGAPLSTFQENSLGYGTVTEYLGEGDNTIGKSEHRFTMTPESNDFFTFPYHVPPDHEWIRGKELSVTHFRKNSNDSYTPVRNITNEYLYAGYVEPSENVSTPAALFSLSYRKLWNQNLQCQSINNEPIELYCTHSGYKKDKNMFRLPLAAIYYDTEFFGAEDVLWYKVYHLTGGTVDLWKSTTTDYFDNQEEMNTATSYTYQYDKHYNVASATQSTSRSDKTLTSKNYYATNDEVQSHSQVAQLIGKNMLDIPVLTETYRNATLLSSKVTEFENWATGVNTLLLPKYIKTSKDGALVENRVEYKYDTFGNVIEASQINGTVSSYIYAYNHTQPVAKIENLHYNQIQTELITAIKAATDIYPNYNNDANLLNALNNLRNSLASNGNIMITTLTYKRLVGVETITDPKGQTTTYQYDGLGRLKQVRDSQGNILTENIYHYKN